MGPRKADELVTIQEAAHELGVSSRTVRRMVDNGRVEIVQFQERGRVYVPRVELVRITRATRKAS